MKEIGGYFQLDEFVKEPYYRNMIELNTGRNALLYLVMAKNIKKVYIPNLLCNSVTDVLKQHSVQYDFYDIGKDLLPLFSIKMKPDEFLYIVNYYGQIDNNIIREYKEKFKRIIIDNTQAFFQDPVVGVDTIYSCRKFFGVPDGAYLFTDAFFELELKIDKSKDRMAHILGRYEGAASDFYIYFQMNDESFYNLELRWMSKLTKNLLGAIDYENTKESRNQNFAYIFDDLQYMNKLMVKKTEGAYAYPFYCNEGMKVRNKLAEKKIYIPTLWPNVLQTMRKGSVEYDYAANILPLPCDQRYKKDDMDILIKEVKKCID